VWCVGVCVGVVWLGVEGVVVVLSEGRLR
jgi:hypothetical protein